MFNLVFNIVILVVLMSYVSFEEYLGLVWSIVVVLSFLLGYGLWDLKYSGKVNGFFVFGIVSVLLIGGISLLKLLVEYIVIKEVVILVFIGIVVLVI